MRTEAEMLAVITSIAEHDPNIRAAYMEGSRINPNAPKDIFQDYDIEFIVNSTEPYRKNKEWIKQFGDILYMHYPEDNVYYPSDPENCYGWQIQFTDGNRLDLHVCTPASLEEIGNFRVLLDKDHILPQSKPYDVSTHLIQIPSEKEFICTCSNFWWCTNNAAKGLWRKELLYTLDVMNYVLRPHLKRLLEWKIGLENNFQITAGKSGKYMQNYLSKELYSEFLSTHRCTSIDETWKSLFKICKIFDCTAEFLRSELSFHYDKEQAENSYYFLQTVSNLPDDADHIF